jgi:hypothetical protein
LSVFSKRFAGLTPTLQKERGYLELPAAKYLKGLTPPSPKEEGALKAASATTSTDLKTMGSYFFHFFKKVPNGTPWLVLPVLILYQKAKQL